MSSDYIALRIEGDFVDSFIYSGSLFIVTADARIKIYDWEELICSEFKGKTTLKDRLIRDFLLDFRAGLSAELEINEYYIDASSLNAVKRSELNLRGWPTDINVYSNRCYIASEHGVDDIKFDYHNKRFDVASKFSLWKSYAYKVSANDSHRIAIAAGINGVVAAIPKSNYISEDSDISVIVEEDSTDCEWIGNFLVSNSQAGSFVSTFAELPKIPKGQVSQDFWKRYDRLKRASPETEKYSIDGVNPYYAWVAGDKLFSIIDRGALVVQEINSVIASEERSGGGEFTAIRDLTSGEIERKIISGRSGSFGTIIETADSLYSVTEDSIQCLSNRPVNWRVFPRARNYINHLHVVEADHLCIRSYVRGGETANNKFGITVSEDDTGSSE